MYPDTLLHAHSFFTALFTVSLISSQSAFVTCQFNDVQQYGTKHLYHIFVAAF
jgi:hypothetical protein